MLHSPLKKSVSYFDEEIEARMPQRVVSLVEPVTSPAPAEAIVRNKKMFLSNFSIPNV